MAKPFLSEATKRKIVILGSECHHHIHCVLLSYFSFISENIGDVLDSNFQNWAGWPDTHPEAGAVARFGKKLLRLHNQ